MKKSGFSLLELSIVLVIIGLIAGGIVAGASMIRAAELRAITTEVTQYRTAVNVFRDKYLGLPGDLRNAFDFWGTECAATDVLCNGDGDGEIFSSSTVFYQEQYQFWAHLSHAELIEGSYTGEDDPNEYTIFGVNVPESKISGAGYTVQPYDGKRMFQFGRHDGTVTHTVATDWAVISPTEAWGIDKKMDNGLPKSGSVQVNNSGAGVTTTCMHATNDEYLLSVEGEQCRMYFEIQR